MNATKCLNQFTNQRTNANQRLLVPILNFHPMVTTTWYDEKHVSHYITSPSLSEHQIISTMAFNMNCEHFQYSDMCVNLKPGGWASRRTVGGTLRN